MKFLLVRKRDAKPIADELLKYLSAINNGWSINFINQSNISLIYKNSENNKDLITSFKAKERGNHEIVLCVNLEDEDDFHKNLTPFTVKDVGNLFVDAYLNSVPDSLEMMHLYTNKRKSQSFIIGEMFNAFCNENEDMKNITKWNRFGNKIKSQKTIVEKNAQMIFVNNEDCHIHILNPESGYYEDGNKIWMSTKKFSNNKVKNETALATINKSVEDSYNEFVKFISPKNNYRDISNKINLMKSIDLDELEDLRSAEIEKLIIEYPLEIAELLKFQNLNYSIDSSAIKDYDSGSCFDCEKLLDMRKSNAVEYSKQYVYICSKCFDENPG